MRWIARFGNWRWGPPLAAWLALPALHVGLVVDDHLLRDRLWTARGIRWRGLLDAFWLVGDVPQLRELGDLPWWSDPQLQLRFFRPLAALTHALDFALLPPWLMHVESMLWLAALNVAVAHWYRRLLEPESAGVASALFAVAPGHVFAASWLANRNAVLAALFAVLALTLYARAREAERTTWPAAALLGLSLLAGEIGVGASALWIAYAACIDRNLRRLAPGLIVSFVWLAVRAALDYGVYASTLYVDPLREPLRFAAAFVEHMPLLLFGVLGVPAITLALLVAHPLAWSGLGSVVLLVPYRLRTDARARFGLLGMLLALIPVAATAVHDRLLIVADVAGLGLLAQALSCRNDRIAKLWLLVRAAASVLLALAYAASMQQHLDQQRAFDTIADAAPVFVNSPCSYYAIQLRRLRVHEGGMVPERVRVLASGLYPLDVERRDAHTLRIRAEGGLLQPLGSYRSPGQKPAWFSPLYLAQTLDHFPRARWTYRRGDTIALRDLTLRVSSAPDGYPEQVDVRFRTPLAEVPLWEWNAGRYRRFAVPAIGARVHLEGTHRVGREHRPP
ncbi:MAG TPA: hypothetical protein VFX59_21790 [Polyangiales bacterium]|nr:hypothetical protein [Polyangiales bacterium]